MASDLLELVGVSLEAWGAYSAAVWGPRFALSDDDIVKLAPPMARVLAKVQKLEALSKYKDEAALILAIAGVYGGRIVAQVMEGRAAEEAANHGVMAGTLGTEAGGAGGAGGEVAGAGAEVFGGARVYGPKQTPDVRYGGG